MIKKYILITFFVLIVGAFTFQFIKESNLSRPEVIYKNIISKYKNLDDLELKSLVYSPQRKIELLVSYGNLIPLARVKIQSQKGSSGKIKLIGLAKTGKFPSVFCKAGAEITSIIDKTNFLPKKYIEDIYYAQKKEYKEITFDQRKNIATREDNKYKVPPMTFCPLSAFYYLQLQDLELGKLHQIKLISKEEVYVLEVKVAGEEGDIVMLDGQIRREDLSSRHGAAFECWMSKELRIPLFLKIKTPVGIVTARAI